MARSICLVNSMISSSVIHSLSVYKWPHLLIKELETASRNFVWTGKISVGTIVFEC